MFPHPPLCSQAFIFPPFPFSPLSPEKTRCLLFVEVLGSGLTRAGGRRGQGAQLKTRSWSWIPLGKCGNNLLSKPEMILSAPFSYTPATGILGNSAPIPDISVVGWGRGWSRLYWSSASILRTHRMVFSFSSSRSLSSACPVVHPTGPDEAPKTAPHKSVSGLRNEWNDVWVIFSLVSTAGKLDILKRRKQISKHNI